MNPPTRNPLDSHKNVFWWKSLIILQTAECRRQRSLSDANRSLRSAKPSVLVSVASGRRRSAAIRTGPSPGAWQTGTAPSHPSKPASNNHHTARHSAYRSQFVVVAYPWHPYGFASVTVIDDDLGRSGSGLVERPGFQKLVASVCSGSA